MNRRSVLKSAGVGLALPWFESFAPLGSARAAAGSVKRRLVAINLGLGMHPDHLFPVRTGEDYETTPYLAPLAHLREHFTLISGTSHPGVDGGHLAEKSFLTCAPHPGSPGFRNSVSLDQVAAAHVGNQTRYPHLALSLSGRSLAWSRNGVEIPSETRPSRVFERLFLEGNPAEKARQVQRLRDGRSIMDTVLDKTRLMRLRLSHRDRDKLDEYLTAVRETEQRLHDAEEWEFRSKPKTDREPPMDVADRNDIIGKAGLLYEMIWLALRSDSTRVVTFFKNGINAVPVVPGVTRDYHNLSHHGRDEGKIAELARIETAQFRLFAGFLDRLRESREEGISLLDQTQVLFGSNLGNASSHNNKNLPFLLAGGGFRHGQHLAFDREKNEASPKLYVSMLQRFGVQQESFAGTSGTLPGLEWA